MPKLREAQQFTLADIPVGAVHEAQQLAAVRIHLFTIGMIHEQLALVSDAAISILSPLPQNEPIPPHVIPQVSAALSSAWNNFIDVYTSLVAFSMRQAASLPFGMLAVMHENYVRPITAVNESFREALGDSPLFRDQLNSIMNAAENHTYGDGLRLSNRIWQLDRWGRQGLNNAVVQAAANGSSAWDLARDVEQYLAPGRNCPRWTRERLYSLTKADIAAGDTTGLISGGDCSGQGVSYNALRLARTEIQTVFSAATTDIFRATPWIEKEQINLSPEHVIPDVCDDFAYGGEKGEGIYLVGTVFLPVHPHCLCYKSSVLMDSDRFTSQLRDWMSGNAQWDAMDQYAAMIGGDMSASLLNDGIAYSLAYWLWSDYIQYGGLFWNMTRL